MQSFNNKNWKLSRIKFLSISKANNSQNEKDIILLKL